MAIIQFKRNLNYTKGKEDCLKFIRNSLELREGEPILCRYNSGKPNENSMLVMCIEANVLNKTGNPNVIKVLDDSWETIDN